MRGIVNKLRDSVVVVRVLWEGDVIKCRLEIFFFY